MVNYEKQIESVVELVQLTEENLLVNIAKKFKNNKQFTEIEKEGNTQLIIDWQLEKLDDLGALNSQNVKTIAKYAKMEDEEILNSLQQTTLKVTQSGESELMAAAKVGMLNQPLPLTESVAVKKTIDNFYKLTTEKFNQLNTSMLVNSGEQYRKVINQVTADVLTGTNTPTQSLKKMINQIGNEGITGLVDKGGRQWSAEAYGRMVINSNVKECAVQATFDRAREYGNDYIEISSHSDARPLCAQDQGKIFSLSDNTESIKDLDGNTIRVYAWSQSTHGQIAGVLGVNCTHQSYDFIPGFSTKTFETSKEIGIKDIKTNYKERERQRKIERNIRSYKTRESMFLAQGDKKSAQQMRQGVSRWQKEMRKFIDDTGRVRNRAREQII